MHMIVKTAAVALGLGALAAPAAAQQPPNARPGATAPQPPPPGARPPANARPGPPRRAPAPYTPEPGVTANFGIHHSGTFTGIIDPATNQFCYMLNTPAVRDPTAAHISLGTPDKPGAAVVTLQTPVDGAAGACQTLPAELAQALEQHAGNYYLDVDNAAFPTGAVRAQLHGVLS